MSTPPLTSPLDSTTAAAPAANVQDAVIRLAGNSQDGIQSIGGFLARLAGRTHEPGGWMLSVDPADYRAQNAKRLP